MEINDFTISDKPLFKLVVFDKDGKEKQFEIQYEAENIEALKEKIKSGLNLRPDLIIEIWQFKGHIIHKKNWG